jgi:tellurite methyltransferase
MSYDEIYQSVKHNFGSEPEPILRNHHHLVNKSKPILDIGAGQGRNCLFLARKGFAVDAIDPSKVASQTIAAIAAQEELSIHSRQCGFDKFAPRVKSYSAILVFGLIQILSWQEIDLLREKIKQWTCQGSLVFITGFMVADASFERYSHSWNTIGKNSFASSQGDLRTYLEPGEMLQLFSGYEVLHHWEGMGPEHRHGDSPMERHAMTEVVFQR